MSYKTLPIEQVKALKPAELQMYMIGLFTSIDSSLKKILHWSVPAGMANQIERSYEAAGLEDSQYDLKDLFGQISEGPSNPEQAPQTEAPAKPARKKAEPKPAEVKDEPKPVAVQETTLGNAPVQTTQNAPAELTLDQVRAHATKFISAKTAEGKEGPKEFLAILKSVGASNLSTLAKDKYAEVVTALVGAQTPAAQVAFDPLA